MKRESFDSVEYRNQYAREHYDRIYLCMPKGTKELMLRRASELGYENKGKPSIAAYIYHLFREDINVTANITNATE